MLLCSLKPKLQEVTQGDPTYPCQKNWGSNKQTLANCTRWFWRYSCCLSLCFDSEMWVVGINVFSAAIVTRGLCWRYIRCVNLSWNAGRGEILPYCVDRMSGTGSILELDYQLWRILQCWVRQYWSPSNVDCSPPSKTLLPLVLEQKWFASHYFQFF